MKPIKTYVLVKLIREEDKSSIILPETIRKERPQQGEVMAIGSEVEEVKVGDLVVFNYAMAQFFEGEGELDVNIAEHILIKEENIYLTYEK